MSKPKTAPARFANGTEVRVQGTDEQVLMLWGRDLVGAVGIIVDQTRRSFGRTRYHVHFPAHAYVTPAKGLVRQIAALTVVLPEDQLVAVEDTEASA